jgi:hypothetical protein
MTETSPSPVGSWSPFTDIAEMRLVDPSGEILSTLPITRRLSWSMSDGEFINQDKFSFCLTESGVPSMIQAFRKDGKQLAKGIVDDNGRQMGREMMGTSIIIRPGQLRLAANNQE